MKKTVFNDTPNSDLVRFFYQLAYFYLYDYLGWTVPVQGILEDNDRVAIAAYKEVKYGSFQPTPFPIIDHISSNFNMQNLNRILDIGSGDGYMVRMLSSYGIHIDGIEQDESLYSISLTLPDYFNKAISSLQKEYSVSSSKLDLLISSVWDSEKRINIKHGDFLRDRYSFKEYDIVYLYYPEPLGINNITRFNNNLDDIITDELYGINDECCLLITRQGKKDPIIFEKLSLVHSPVTIKTGSILSSESTSKLVSRKGISNHITLYQYSKI